jgi:hypothetical protein
MWKAAVSFPVIFDVGTIKACINRKSVLQTLSRANHFLYSDSSKEVSCLEIECAFI